MMANSIDRQGALDNLTGIESTARILLNAFVKKNNDAELALNGIHREELIEQTTEFLTEARTIILNLAKTLNLASDEVFDQKNHSVEGINAKSSPIKQTYSLSSVTLDEILENRLTPKHLISNYPLLHDPIQPNLVALARNIRQIENLDELILKIYSKIFNHEERICCNYDGLNGKLPYPRHKRLLFDLMIKLALHERKKSSDNHDQAQFYSQCEKHFSNDTSLTKYRGSNLDQINHMNDEEQFVCSLFRLIIPAEDIKKIIAAKQESNENELAIYHARPIHLLWIKQKWLERFPLNGANESQKWSQCIDWAMDSFLDTNKVRPSKRKTMDAPTDSKRSKTSLTLKEKIKKIDRTKFDVFEYTSQLLHLIADENKKNLPTFEQLQLIELYVLRYYWTIDQEKTWSKIFEMISHVFANELKDDFRQIYYQNLLDINPNEQKEIERLFQIIVPN